MTDFSKKNGCIFVFFLAFFFFSLDRSLNGYVRPESPPDKLIEAYTIGLGHTENCYNDEPCYYDYDYPTYYYTSDYPACYSNYPSFANYFYVFYYYDYPDYCDYIYPYNPVYFYCY